MMSSAAVWAIVVNNFSFHYAFYVIMNWLPTYFNHVLKVRGWGGRLGGAQRCRSCRCRYRRTMLLPL